jgi:hypothetical protein
LRTGKSRWNGNPTSLWDVTGEVSPAKEISGCWPLQLWYLSATQLVQVGCKIWSYQRQGITPLPN